MDTISDQCRFIIFYYYDSAYVSVSTVGVCACNICLRLPCFNESKGRFIGSLWGLWQDKHIYYELQTTGINTSNPW